MPSAQLVLGWLAIFVFFVKSPAVFTEALYLVVHCQTSLLTVAVRLSCLQVFVIAINVLSVCVQLSCVDGWFQKLVAGSACDSVEHQCQH